MQITVENDEEQRVFYFEEEGQRGELRYFREGNLLDLTHTHVPKALERRGYGTELVRSAVRFAERRGYKVIPSCPFVEAYFDKNPEERSLLAHA